MDRGLWLVWEKKKCQQANKILKINITIKFVWLRWYLIVVKGTMSVTNPNNNAYDKKLAFKNNAPFISCISKINSTLADNAEGLDIAMPMYNLIEYSKNY